MMGQFVSKMWRGTGGGSLGKKRELEDMGEERVRSGISMRAGSGREIQKGNCSLFITAYHPVKNTNPAMFLTEASNKILYVRKRKFLLRLKNRISFGEIGNLFKSFTSLVTKEMTLHMYTFVSISQAVEILCTK